MIQEGLRALSIHRPWAQLIITGKKTVENRTWTTRRRGPLLIHAAQPWDGAGALAAAGAGLHLDRKTAATGYLGIATLRTVHAAADCDCDSPWADSRYCHWVLDDIRPFANPIPGPGRQQLFVPQAAELAQIEQAIRELETGAHTAAVDEPAPAPAPTPIRPDLAHAPGPIRSGVCPRCPADDPAYLQGTDMDWMVHDRLVHNPPLGGGATACSASTL